MATIAEHLGLESATEAARRESRDFHEVEYPRRMRGVAQESSAQRALRHAGVREVEVLRLPPAADRPRELYQIAVEERRQRGART